jgi:RNA-directed DNA polymerase
VVGDGTLGRYGTVSRETCQRGDAGRSQSLHSTVAALAAGSPESKVGYREGRQEGGCVKSEDRQSNCIVSPVSRHGGSKQDTETYSWVEASIWTKRMLAALENGVKGGKWFSLIDKVARLQTLEIAWRKVARNKGAAGVDGQSVKRFGCKSTEYLGELSQALTAGTYRPQPVKRVEIPKGLKKKRPLGIPVVKDRIVQTALKMVIEPIFENEFVESSYGFRPGRGCRDALREVDRLIKRGYTHVVDADVASYFDTIPHNHLVGLVEQRISDGRVLDLIRGYLEQEVISGLKRWTPTGGTPQGAVISPLLANLYLHPLDCLMRARGYRMVRYADDFVVMCPSRETAQAAFVELRRWLSENGLTLHPDKTHMGDCMVPGQGFEFLGYRFEAGKRWVRKKSLKALRDRIRSRTKRSRGDSMAQIIESLNPMLRGWFGYFKHANPYAFRTVDGFIRRRLRAVLRKQQKVPGMGHCQLDHQRWPNAYFAELGLFTMTEAHALASRSRC